MPSYLKRRAFLQKSALGALAAGGVGLAACSGGEQPVAALATSYDPAKAQFKWKMVTTWPPHFPSLGEGVDLFAKWLLELSGGRLHVHVYGANELVPPLEVFEAVTLGAVELGHSAPYYWSGKAPASQFFASIPFGMNAQQMQSWIVRGGGLELWRETYAPFGVVPFLGGSTGMQFGGWFRREINGMADLQGLIMRIPGLGGKILKKAGVSVVSTPGSEIYTSLERGVIDATEWIGPYHDYILGLHRVAKYYYYPGWHEPGTPLEVLVNQKALASLPPDLQAVVETATAKLHNWIFAENEIKNAEYLDKLLNEEKITLKRFPTEVLDQLKIYAKEVYAELAAQDPLSKKVYAAYEAFRQKMTRWHATTEQVYYDEIQEVPGAS
jgi:TRAP-type mannitol/chloroaromatic compound transport system substrate-binding protein